VSITHSSETPCVIPVAPSSIPQNVYQEGDLAAIAAQGLATQYSTYASRHRTTQDDTQASDLFDLDLNPDF